MVHSYNNAFFSHISPTFLDGAQPRKRLGYYYAIIGTQTPGTETPSTADRLRRTAPEIATKQTNHEDQSCNHKNTEDSPSSPTSPVAHSHGEPKQPGNIQDYLELRLDEACKPPDKLDGTDRSDDSGWTKKEVKAILSGAPHFLLERGRHGRWYPQVLFPWDDHHPYIQRMRDRKPLLHQSFTLCTLHAHLPVLDDWEVKNGVLVPVHDWRRTGGSKRAAFDVGVFEVPNMLANNGHEPGTFGYRNFLEIPIADVTQYTCTASRQAPDMVHISELVASEAQELMMGYNHAYSQCQSGAVFDRKKLIREGPVAWKRIGVRDVNLLNLTNRLSNLQKLRDDVMKNGSKRTILDYESPRQLLDTLHTQFLHPHPPMSNLKAGYPHSLKSQIKVLTTVLATPGAWIDFSIPEWRLRAGQILWEVPPPLPSASSGKPQDSWINSGMERKWLLIQLVLAAELLFRLDAFVRVGMLHDPHGGFVTSQELQHFEKMRDGKVNWDLVVVRRFLDSINITSALPSPESSPTGLQSPHAQDKAAGKSRHFALFESISRRVSSNAESNLKSAWQYQLTSPHIQQQLDGLYIFAENIGWPMIDRLKATLEQKLRSGTDLVIPPVDTDVCSQVERELPARSFSCRPIWLRSTCEQDGDPHALDPLGWISRSWLSGFVAPGGSIPHLLIGTILENDADAIMQVGPMANLYGGFIYDGRSWWSKSCIIGRVLSGLEGAKTCMGWVGSDVLPRDAVTLETLQPGWFDVHAHHIAPSHHPRIKQGGKLALKSTPLGTGDISPTSFTLPVDPPQTGPALSVGLGALEFTLTTPNKRNITVSEGASLSFSWSGTEVTEPSSVTFSLKYNVRFISTIECRPPRGMPCEGKLKRLPGHPLHQTFQYQYVPLVSLPTRPPPQAQAKVPGKDVEILVIDARGDRVTETFARAWCTSVGCHALISRVGRTCIACSVREARAVGVSVVVRVGE
ncbi:hypothetical protein N7495_007452 [Penicillium taxi]|uniref:uncharacterized protein n=1 Tax=Penicillium taxi TaxID=168475 RepID=UPI00254565B7|nr:uncharacterized protein N7495_007452 [Penicillium taxi]KAJ5887411.1 hypothetical protein N7495_007452 [Penicillium taxi]